MNPNITMEFIEKHPENPWNWYFISRNPNITLEIIEKYINKIHFGMLSQNEFISQNRLNKQKQVFRLLENVHIAKRLPKLVNMYLVKQYL